MTTMAYFLLIGILVSASGCADTNNRIDDGSVSQTDTSSDLFSATKQGIYFSTPAALFHFNTDPVEIVRMADFQWHETFPVGMRFLDDIAVNQQGEVWGLSSNALYVVESKTGKVVAHPDGIMLPVIYDCLAFSSFPINDIRETLLAYRYQHLYVLDARDLSILTELHVVEPITDMVSIDGIGTFAAVSEDNQEGTQSLARIDLNTGKIELIGNTGFDIKGLGFWEGEVYGVTYSGQIVRIDMETGKGVLILSTDHKWVGAGSMPNAPLIKRK